MQQLQRTGWPLSGVDCAQDQADEPDHVMDKVRFGGVLMDRAWERRGQEMEDIVMGFGCDRRNSGPSDFLHHIPLDRTSPPFPAHRSSSSLTVYSSRPAHRSPPPTHASQPLPLSRTSRASLSVSQLLPQLVVSPPSPSPLVPLRHPLRLVLRAPFEPLPPRCCSPVDLTNPRRLQHPAFIPVSAHNLPILAASIVSQLSSHHTDEDFINKSLLDSLDAQADAEPISSSDSEQAAPHSYSSASNSSSGSPSVPFHFAMHSHQQPPTRSDSPVDNNASNIPDHIYPQDSLYSVHPSQNALYANSHSSNAMRMTSEYASDLDIQKQLQHQSGKINGFNSNTYRASFTSYPNATRPRHHTTVATMAPGNTFRDSSPYYPTSADVFPSQVTSPTQAHAQPYDSRASFDFGGGQQAINGSHKPSYLADPYVPSSAMLQSHQVGSKPGQQQHTAYSAQSAQYSNGMHLSSQTPYGPHVPTTGPTSATSGVSPGAPPGLTTANINITNVNGTTSNTEEISTIFVVGFPEDMQEREFQNMFTFSPGFEAATLKIPNKEYTAYGGIIGAGPSIRAAAGQAYQAYAGSNDPYNLVTVNQGGVVVDGGRDGTMASWPASVPGDDAAHFLGGGAAGLNMAPRKQIIGFAKFRSREEALAARDVLQGRRVDIEKGAVLKAEMAKKNLHTKRGVGPVPGTGGSSGAVGSAGGVVSASAGVSSSLGGSSGMGGLQQSIMNGGAPSDLYNMGAGEAMSARDRELGAIGAMGLGLGGGHLTQWRDQMQQDPNSSNGITHLNGAVRERDEDRRRERDIAMGLGSTRGPRERAEDDDRERRRKEKELRLRAGNSTAFDAFHSVPLQAPPGISRQPSNNNVGSVNPFLAPLDENTAGLISPMAGNGNGYLHHHQMLTQSSLASMQPHDDAGMMTGPWDSMRKGPVSHVGRPLSERSSSPIHPSSAITSNSFPDGRYSPSLDNRTPNQHYPFHDVEPRLHHAHSESSSSSVAGSQSAGRGSVTHSTKTDGADGEISRAVGGLAVSTNNGNTSPQLPSPASGASSGSARNVVDQNPPINTLYVGNLPTSPPPIGFPQDYLEDSLRELFSPRPGFRRLCFRQKNNGPMCFVEFEDVNHATKALNDLYGNTLKGLIKGGGIRLSYSKNPLGVRTPTSAGSNGPSLQQQQLQTISPTSHHQSAGGSLSFASDVFQPKLQQSGEDHQRRTTILQRDIAVVSPPPPSNNSYINNYMVSSPPRFFTSSPPSAMSGASTSFLPRNGNGSLYSYSSNPTSAFSPFGMSNSAHSLISDQNNASDEQSHSHYIHRALSPPTNNLEAARAG